MIIDYNLVLGDAQAITTSAATTNIVDALAAGDAFYPGAMVKFLVDTAVTNSAAANVTFDLQTAVDSAFASPITLSSSGVIAKASLIAGYMPFQCVIPAGVLRFLRGYYTLSSACTGGKVDCRIVLAGDSDVNIDYNQSQVTGK